MNSNALYLTLVVGNFFLLERHFEKVLVVWWAAQKKKFYVWCDNTKNI